MAEQKKVRNPNRFYFNPEDPSQKVYTEYVDGSKISLSKEEQEKADKWKSLMISKSVKGFSKDNILSRKPKHLREGKRVPDKKEEKNDKTTKEDEKVQK